MPADPVEIGDTTRRWTPSNTPIDALVQGGVQFAAKWPDFGAAFIENFFVFEYWPLGFSSGNCSSRRVCGGVECSIPQWKMQWCGCPGNPRLT
ncbi:MAG: hypothetical protein R2748_23655 [Bryobacterales bacterium]